MRWTTCGGQIVSLQPNFIVTWGKLSRGKLSFIKALYFSSRYGLLVLQLWACDCLCCLSLTIMDRIDKYLYFRFQGNSLPPLMCAKLFVYKTVIAQVSMTLVEMILLIRGTASDLPIFVWYRLKKLKYEVYALYNNGFKARYILLAVFIISTSLECTAIKMIVETLLSFPACIAPVMDGMIERLYGSAKDFILYWIVLTHEIHTELELDSANSSSLAPPLPSFCQEGRRL